MKDPYEDVLPRYGVVKRGKLVTFYKNGDPHFKGLQTSVSGKHFVAMHTLLSWLNDKIDTVNGVKYIFALPDGREINEVTRFEAGGIYAVSSVRPFLNIPYGLPRHRYTRHEDQPAQRFRAKIYPEMDQLSNTSDDLFGSPLSLPVLKPTSNSVDKNQNGRGRNNERSSDLLVAERIASPRSRSWGSPTRSHNNNNNSNNKMAAQDSIELPVSSKSSIINEMREELSRQGKIDSNRYTLRCSTTAEKEVNAGQFVDREPSRVSLVDQSVFGASKRASLDEVSRPIERDAQEHRKRKHEAAGKKSQSAPIDQFNDHQNIWSPLSFQGEYYSKAKPRLLLIISNTDRSSRQRVIFNPRTLQSFEEVLADISRIVNVLQPPVTALYSARPPFVKVLGISHLTRALKNCDELLACGTEQIPIEMHSLSYLQDRVANHNDQTTNMRSSKSLDYINTGDAIFAEDLSSKKKKKVPTATLR